MPALAARLSVERGGQPGFHKATRLTAQLVRESHLVVGMAREHRSAAIRLHPRASRYSFTLRELSRLVSSNALGLREGLGGLTKAPTEEALKLAVELISRHRGFATPPGYEYDDDVIDPYKRPEAAYQQMAWELDEALSRIETTLSALPREGRLQTD